MQKIKRILAAVLCFVLMIPLFTFMACGEEESKEDIVVKVATQIADDFAADAYEFTIVSGTVEFNEETGKYDCWAKIDTQAGTMYFTAEYDAENEEIDYDDMTDILEDSVVGPGPKYLATDSFDIREVNERLAGGSDTNEPNEPEMPEEPEVCENHTGRPTCSVCGLDYYTELKNLVIEHGRAGGTAGSYVYDGETVSTITLSTYVMYDSVDDEITLFATWDFGFEENGLIVTIADETEIENCRFEWMGQVSSSSNEAYASGTVYAAIFTQETERLTATSNYGVGGTDLEIFATMLRSIFSRALNPLLRLGNNNLSLYNLGFISY